MRLYASYRSAVKEMECLSVSNASHPALWSVILAAGKGTRMRSPTPKVLHKLAGRTMLGHVMTVVSELGSNGAVLVTSPGTDAIASEAGRYGVPLQVSVQDPPLGTGHAVMAALPHLPVTEGTALVMYGDTPLITTATMQALVDARNENDAAVVVLGMEPPDSSGYGRFVVGDAPGTLTAIVEEKHADEALKRDGICNAGVMAIDLKRLRTLLDAIEIKQPKGEYYLTDIVELAVARGWTCLHVEGHWHEGLGVNSQAQRAEADAIMQDRLRLAMLEAGVTMYMPESTYLSADTVIGAGTQIEPHVVFAPGVTIGENCHIRAFSHLEGAVVGNDVEIGPSARLRPGAVMGDGSKIGNYVEVKNTSFGRGAKANHLSYVGDAEVGERANIGAGTITCNYDGFNKHRTIIGEEAFIGTNTSLVAPVSVGDRANTGAGSVITRDIADDSLAIERSDQVEKPGKARSMREKLAAIKAARSSGQ